MSDTAGPSRTTDVRPEEDSPKKRNRSCCSSMPPWLWPRESEQPSQQEQAGRQAESGNRTRDARPEGSSTPSRSRYIRPWYRKLWTGSEQGQAEQRNHPDEQTSLVTPEPPHPWDKFCSEIDSRGVLSDWWSNRTSKEGQVERICNAGAIDIVRYARSFFGKREELIRKTSSKDIRAPLDKSPNELSNLEKQLLDIAKKIKKGIEEIYGDSYKEYLTSKDTELRRQLSQPERSPFEGQDRARQNRYPLLHEITNFIVFATALEKPEELVGWQKQRILKEMSATAENIDRLHNQGLAEAAAHVGTS